MTTASRNLLLLLLLLLQLNGAGGNPSFALVPQRAPTSSPERAIIPLALHYRRQILAQINLIKCPARLDPTACTPPTEPTRSAEEQGRPTLGGTDLLYMFMTLTR